jgi:mono/diheme cytochrome c family protein
MRKLMLFAGTLALPLVLAAASPVASRGSDMSSDAAHAKDLFLAQHCNTCHSIESQDITRKTKSEKMKGPDLSNIGNEKKAEWITGWLKKEEEIDGKHHKGRFKGTDAQMKELVNWLETLKTEK